MTLLRKAICQDTPFLISGPVGSSSLKLAQSFLSLYPKEQNLIDQGDHPDLIYFDARDKESNVAATRHLRDFVSGRPVRLDFVYLVILYPDRLSLASVNALLILLENPPKHLKIILLSGRLHFVLPTIKSRVLHISLPPPSREEMVEELGEEASWRIDRSGNDLEVARFMDVDVVGEWERFWELSFSGTCPDPGGVYSWIERYGQQSEVTQLACWHSLLYRVGKLAWSGLYWRWFGEVVMELLEVTRSGRSNDLFLRTKFTQLYALAKTAVVRT